MDLFDEILKQASSNNATASKEIRSLDKMRDSEKRNRMERDVSAVKEQHRKLMLNKQCSGAAAAAAAAASSSNDYNKSNQSKPEKPKFSIPKLSASRSKEKNEASGTGDVDARIAAFMEKKKQQEKKEAIERQRQKEKLIQLRLQNTFGGRANKKLAKQFGTTPIELQQRYGNDREHEEYLRKLQNREEEEFDRQCTELRGSVLKAMERKREVDRLAPSEEERRALGKCRVASNKQNSLRHFMKEDSPVDGPSTSKNVVSMKKKQPLPNSQTQAKKRPPPPGSAIDFSLLMKKAEAIQRGERPPKSPTPVQCRPSPSPEPPPPKKRNPYYEPLNHREPSSSSKNSNNSANNHSSTNNVKRQSNDTNKLPSSSSSSTFKQSQQNQRNAGVMNKYNVGTVKSSANATNKNSSSASIKASNPSSSSSHSEAKDESTSNRNQRPVSVRPVQKSSSSQSSAHHPATKNSSALSSSTVSSKKPALNSNNDNNNASSTNANRQSAPTKRYLPGDIRYQGPPPASSSLSSRDTSNPKIAASGGRLVPGSSLSGDQKGRNAGAFNERSREFDRKSVDSRSRPDERQQSRNEPARDKMRRNASSSSPTAAAASASRPSSAYHQNADRSDNLSKRPMSDRDRSIMSSASLKAKERMILEQRRRREMARQQRSSSSTSLYHRDHFGNNRNHRTSNSYNRDYDDAEGEELDDEEYDSDMDDFIDDSEFDDHLKRKDFEETLRLINPHYDRNRWRMNERLIDDRRMEANYRDITREEVRSSRIGLLEDIREAERGNSYAL